jgi:hypothetical protein
MKLGEFIKQFSHNNIIRLVYKMPGGHEVVLDNWNDVSMDHEITRQRGKFRHYIDNEVLGLAGIVTEGRYPEAINIVIERLEDQPFLDDLSKEEQTMSMAESLEN